MYSKKIFVYVLPCIEIRTYSNEYFCSALGYNNKSIKALQIDQKWHFELIINLKSILLRALYIPDYSRLLYFKSSHVRSRSLENIILRYTIKKE